MLAHAADLYGLPSPLTLERLTELAEPWRPFRTWVTVLLRLAGDRSRQRSTPTAVPRSAASASTRL